MAAAASSICLATMTQELDIESLYREHGQFVVRVLERLCGCGPHIDDLVQETFLAAHNKRSTYDKERALVTTWLYGIAANMSRRHLRSQGRFGFMLNRFEKEPEQQVVARPDAALEAEEAARLVAHVLQSLPIKQREVFALYELEQMDGPAISAMLAIPEGTVWTRLHHGRKRFSEVMRKKLGSEVAQ